MNNSTFLSASKLFGFLAFLIVFNLNAQDKSTDIIDNYQNYTSDAREVVYVHLNKSAYIKGESIGFTAYVLDKKNKKPSLVTTNLYISIEDKNNTVIKQKLLKVNNGVVSNIIELDSTFNSGYYTFKAYTNWMRNFDEQNYFIESIRVIDPKTEQYIETASIENSIDAQFLPEGGHLLNGVINNVGVILKDSEGYGVAAVKGEVRDNKNNLITEFEVNKFGIGKFPLLAELGKSYKVNLSYLNKDHSFILKEKIEPIGVTMSLVEHKNKAIVSLTTNKESLELIKNKPYKLAVHNGDGITTLDIVFNNQLTIIKAFDLNDLPAGINMFTLFNENNEPFIERLFFNYEGIEILTSNDVAATKANDSVTVKLNLKQVNASAFNNVSISILPQETSSYYRHHNMLSYSFLQPYVRGTIEQAKYYFSNITQEKRSELDNLLITQGWSSYDWNAIFKPNTGLNYPFEQGITLKANINGDTDESDKYMVHALYDQQPQYFKADKTSNTFLVENVFLNDDDKIYLSKVTKNDELKPAKLYLQSFPSKIPSFQTKKDVLKPKWDYLTFAGLTNTNISFLNITNTQALDEVVLNSVANKKRLRTEELSKGRLGQVKVVDDADRIQFQTLANFLNFSGLRASDESRGDFSVSTFSGGVPIIFLDDMRLLDTSILYRFPLNNVDYVEINRFDNGTTINSSGGILKIYTDYTVRGSRANAQSTQDYQLPLTFSQDKKFYVPKYNYYNDDFYKGYGTVDWKPNLVTDDFGNISFKIAQPEIPITLFIEGIANDGSFIFEEKTISLN